jgi:hypothetical protein
LELLLNEMPVFVDNLKNVQLTIETTDAQDFKAKRVVKVDFQDNVGAVETFVGTAEKKRVFVSSVYASKRVAPSLPCLMI